MSLIVRALERHGEQILKDNEELILKRNEISMEILRLNAEIQANLEVLDLLKHRIYELKGYEEKA